MKFNFLFFSLTLFGLLTVMGCSGTSEKNADVDTTSGIEQGSNAGNSEGTIPKPPGLTIYAGEEIVRPVLGTYSWNMDHGDGTTSGIEADSAAPPELVQDSNPTLVTSDTSIDLDFEEQPESYTVRRWDEDSTIVSESNEVILSDEGKVIYEVLAHWEKGTASYAFSLNIE